MSSLALAYRLSISRTKGIVAAIFTGKTILVSNCTSTVPKPPLLTDASRKARPALATMLHKATGWH